MHHGYVQGALDVQFDTDVTLGPIIGSGAFGSVYKGKWRSLEVAVKMVTVMDSEKYGSKELDSLKSEIEVLSRLQHPNIICFYGACLVPPHVCILEELASSSLANRLHGSKQVNRPLTYVEVGRYHSFGGVCTARLATISSFACKVIVCDNPPGFRDRNEFLLFAPGAFSWNRHC